MSEEIKQKASWAVPWENQLNELLEEKIQDVYNAGSKYFYVYDNTTETYTSCGSEIHTLLNKELGDFINSLLSQALQKRDEAIIKMLENTDVQMSVNGDVSKDEIAMAKFIYKAHIRHIIKKIESAITPPNSINGTLPSDTDSATK